MTGGSKCVNCGREFGFHRAKELACPTNPDIHYSSGNFSWKEGSFYRSKKELEKDKEEYKKICVEAEKGNYSLSKASNLWKSFPEPDREELREWYRNERIKKEPEACVEALPEKKKLKAHDIKLPEPPDGWSWSPSPFSGNFNFTLDGPSGNFVKSIDSGIFCFYGRRFNAEDVAANIRSTPRNQDFVDNNGIVLPIEAAKIFMSVAFPEIDIETKTMEKDKDIPEDLPSLPEGWKWVQVNENCVWLGSKNNGGFLYNKGIQEIWFNGKCFDEKTMIKALEASEGVFNDFPTMIGSGKVNIADRKNDVISVPYEAAMAFMSVAFPGELKRSNPWLFDFNDGNGPVPAKRHKNPDGTIGGWIANSAFVEPSAFVGHNALVYQNARVYDKGYVAGEARVYGNASVYDHSKVYNKARLYDRACIINSAQIYGNAHVFGNGFVRDNALVFEHAKVCGRADIEGNALVCEDACIFEDAKVGGSAQVYGTSIVKGSARIFDNVKIGKDSEIKGKAKLKGGSRIIDKIFSFDFSYSDVIADGESEKEMAKEKERVLENA